MAKKFILDALILFCSTASTLKSLDYHFPSQQLMQQYSLGNWVSQTSGSRRQQDVSPLLIRQRHYWNNSVYISKVEEYILAGIALLASL